MIDGKNGKLSVHVEYIKDCLENLRSLFSSRLSVNRKVVKRKKKKEKRKKKKENKKETKRRQEIPLKFNDGSSILLRKVNRFRESIITSSLP